MQPPPDYVFLHIGKTGGTALRDMILRAAVPDKIGPDKIGPDKIGPDTGVPNTRVPDTAARIQFLPHATSLQMAAAQFPQARIGFVLRDPTDRAVSGFLSRLRCGRPRYDNPWTKAEARVFNRFPTPTALGEALAQDDPAAAEAMTIIRHLKMDYPHYLGTPETVQAHLDRIFFIGHMTTLQTDVARLKRLLDLPADLALSDDPVATHRNPTPDLAQLSPLARDGFTRALANDYAVYAHCNALRAQGPLAA